MKQSTVDQTKGKFESFKGKIVLRLGQPEAHGLQLAVDEFHGIAAECVRHNYAS